MSRLTRDGTAEPISRDQILRHARGQGILIFPVRLTTSRIGCLTRLIHTLLYVMTIHTYIHTVDPRLLPSGNPFKYHVEALSLQPMKTVHHYNHVGCCTTLFLFCFCFLSGTQSMLLPSGNPFKCHEEVLYLQPMIPPKLDIFPTDRGMLGRSRRVQIFLYIP